MKEKGGKRRDEGAAAHGGKEHFRRCSRHFNPHWVDFLPLAREKCYEFAFCRLDCENSWRMPDDFPFFSPSFSSSSSSLYTGNPRPLSTNPVRTHLLHFYFFWQPTRVSWTRVPLERIFVFFGYDFHICNIRRIVQVWCNLRKNDFVFSQNAK